MNFLDNVLSVDPVADQIAFHELIENDDIDFGTLIEKIESAGGRVIPDIVLGFSLLGVVYDDASPMRCKPVLTSPVVGFEITDGCLFPRMYVKTMSGMTYRILDFHLLPSSEDEDHGSGDYQQSAASSRDDTQQEESKPDDSRSAEPNAKVVDGEITIQVVSFDEFLAIMEDLLR